MAMGRFILKVKGDPMTFDNAGEKYQTGGDTVSRNVRLYFHNGTGQTCTAGEILYTEGTQGNMDFFEIKSSNDVTFVGDGILSVVITLQLNMMGGTYRYFYPTILGSLPFEYRVEGS